MLTSWLLNRLGVKPTVQVDAEPGSGEVTIGILFRGFGPVAVMKPDTAQEIASGLIACANEARGFPRE